MKIAVYLSGIPRKSQNESKKRILRSFAQGAERAGDQVILVEDNRIVDCDVAVIQGFVHEHSKQAPHLLIRKQAIDFQKQNNKHSVIIDSNLYQFLDTQNIDKYLRYSIGGIFPTDAWYFDQDRDLTRWNKIKSSYQFSEQEWHTGHDILICFQRNGGWSMNGYSVTEWAVNTINKIRKVTQRPIVVRGHPGDHATLKNFDISSWTNIRKQEPGQLLLSQQLKQTHATITYNSSPGVASLLSGVPVFVTDPVPERSQCWPICNTDLDKVENPILFDRQDFYHRLAQCHWTLDEVASGDAWKFMRNRLPSYE
jgi:hypothetical protein